MESILPVIPVNLPMILLVSFAITTFSITQLQESNVLYVLIFQIQMEDIILKLEHVTVPLVSLGVLLIKIVVYAKMVRLNLSV